MPVILAHCITDNVPIGNRDDWNGAVLPLGSDWVRHLYTYMDVYVKKVRAALIQIGEWDRSDYYFDCYYYYYYYGDLLLPPWVSGRPLVAIAIAIAIAIATTTTTTCKDINDNKHT